MNIYEKLAVIQQELVAPKNQYNSYGKYNYRSCEDILEGVKPLLKKVNATLRITDEIVIIGERHYIRAKAILTDCENGEGIFNEAYAREEEVVKGMSSSQITGSASSYARKYALNGLFCIDDVKDADTRDNRKKGEENKKIPEVKIKALLARCESENVEPKRILTLYKVSSLADLTEKQFLNINTHWKKIKEGK